MIVNPPVVKLYDNHLKPYLLDTEQHKYEHIRTFSRKVNNKRIYLNQAITKMLKEHADTYPNIPVIFNGMQTISTHTGRGLYVPKAPDAIYANLVIYRYQDNYILEVFYATRSNKENEAT